MTSLFSVPDPVTFRVQEIVWTRSVKQCHKSLHRQSCVADQSPQQTPVQLFVIWDRQIEWDTRLHEHQVATSLAPENPSGLLKCAPRLTPTQSLSKNCSGSESLLLVGEADPPPRRPRHAASPSSAPDGRRSALGVLIVAHALSTGSFGIRSAFAQLKCSPTRFPQLRRSCQPCLARLPAML